MDFCIINGKIITMENENIENGYIKIRDGKISEIGHMKDFENDNSCLEITDAGGAIITPGMIDAHSHIGMWEDGIASVSYTHLLYSHICWHYPYQEPQ